MRARLTTISGEQFLFQHQSINDDAAAMTRALHATADLVKKGWCHATVVENDDHVLTLTTLDGKLVALMTFGPLDGSQNDWEIGIGWVHNKYRRRGLYTYLWKRLVKHAKKQGVKRIERCHHVDNSAMIGVCEKQGCKSNRFGAYVDVTYMVS